ncbi:MAG: phospho-N-acetylmuramoyl-pentapeptide-transferase [Dehalococcoidia bacterium]
MITDALVLSAIAIVAVIVAGYPGITLLNRLKLGKEISAWGPDTHQVKAGTPTMGGIIILAVIGALTVTANLVDRWSIGLPLLVMAALGALGVIDDLGSLQERQQKALTRRVKLVVFIAIAVGAAIALYHEDLLGLETAHIPYHGPESIGWVYVPIAITVIVLTAGGVAVTDGLDGLAASTCAVAYGAYGLLALYQDQAYLGIFCLTVTGATIGFLWHNSYPARVFMGDAGALSLGGGLAIVAFLTGQWLILPIIAIIFVIEGLSVGMQVGYFRLTGGKRLFKMAPIHHHFEKIGWSEVQVTQRFWIVQALGATIGLVLALEVYP